MKSFEACGAPAVIVSDWHLRYHICGFALPILQDLHPRLQVTLFPTYDSYQDPG